MASELDWSVRELLWNMVPKSRDQISEWEEIVWGSSEVMLAAQNGGEFGIGEWDEEAFGRRGIGKVGTLIPIVLYQGVLVPELDGDRSESVLRQCADFIERVLDEYHEIDYLIVDIVDYFEVNESSWVAFREYAGPSFAKLMRGEGLV